jgi:hypothetical protein
LKKEGLNFIWLKKKKKGLRRPTSAKFFIHRIPIGTLSRGFEKRNKSEFRKAMERLVILKKH